jgi:hypothetical protein
VHGGPRVKRAVALLPTSERVRGDPMDESAGEFVERVRDRGQWFDRGLRVEVFQTRPAHHELERAALGSYEVLGCERVEAGGGSWLDVRLRHAFPSSRPPRRRQ